MNSSAFNPAARLMAVDRGPDAAALRWWLSVSERKRFGKAASPVLNSLAGLPGG
jgi:hypothetical protein